MAAPFPATLPFVQTATPPQPPQTILSFDVEEHFRIEAAVGLEVTPRLQTHYAQRMEIATRWLLDRLAERNLSATFFVVGRIARSHPTLVRAISQAGHEVASHSWDHQALYRLNARTFREDVRRSKEALEDVTGTAVVGYRAPTFSVLPRTAWAIDVLAELGMEYDSSIYPVWHDRYGVPNAPRTPFWAQGQQHRLLELPPATLRLLGMNLAVGGGGYFRLLPLLFMKWGIRQLHRHCQPSVAMLYFHPWEFDPDQERLPLARLSRWRTYAGLQHTQKRLARLLASGRFVRAMDVARGLQNDETLLPVFPLLPRKDIEPLSAAPTDRAPARAA